MRALSTSLENMCSPKPGNWQSQHLYQKINTGFHARIPVKPQYLKVVKLGSYMMKQ